MAHGCNVEDAAEIAGVSLRRKSPLAYNGGSTTLKNTPLLNKSNCGKNEHTCKPESKQNPRKHELLESVRKNGVHKTKGTDEETSKTPEQAVSTSGASYPQPTNYGRKGSKQYNYHRNHQTLLTGTRKMELLSLGSEMTPAIARCRHSSSFCCHTTSGV